MTHPVGIVLIHQARATDKYRKYNWLCRWGTPWDSAYASLSRFGFLNAFAAKDLAALFLRRSKQSSGGTDLRIAAPFRTDAFTRHTEATDDSLIRAFVQPTFQENNQSASKYLRFCRRCLNYGLHISYFQLNEIEQCPIHECGFDVCCPHCRGLVPYALVGSVFSTPFHCPNCRKFLGNDFEMALRREVLSSDRSERIEAIFQILVRREQIYPAWGRFERTRQVGAEGDWVCSDSHTAQRSAVRLCFLEHATLARGSDGDVFPGSVCVEHLRRWRRSSLGQGSRGSRTLASKRGSALASRIATNERMYLAIRRRIWRREIGEHCQCCVAAARHYWWDIEGELLPAICPHARAWIGWRMYWEGVRIPQRLMGKPAHGPERVVAWVLGDAPFLPSKWSTEEEEWLTVWIFARHCLAHFRELLAHSMSGYEWGGQWIWKGSKNEPSHAEQWLAYLGDQDDRFLRVWFQRTVPSKVGIANEEFEGHWKHHISALATSLR